MAHNSDGAPEAENNMQSAQARSQNGRSRQRRPPGMLPCTLTYRPAVLFFITARAFTASLGAGGGRRRFLLVAGLHAAADPALGGPADHLPALPAEDRSRRPDQPGGEADQASRQRSRRLLCEAPEYLSARGASSRRQQARRLSLARTVPPVAGSCSACTGTAHRAGTSGISYGPQVRTSNTSRSSPPLSAR
jgi:hypothetical protein